MVLNAVEAGTTERDEAVPSIGLVACWSCRGPGRSDGAVLRNLRGGAAAWPGRSFRPAGLVPRLTRSTRRCSTAATSSASGCSIPTASSTRTPRERALSQQQATALNEAYETLKDPLRRADYSCFCVRHAANPGRLQPGQRPGAADRSAGDARGAGRGQLTAARSTRLARRARPATSRLASRRWPMRSPPTTSTAASRLATRLKYLRKLADDCRARRLTRRAASTVRVAASMPPLLQIHEPGATPEPGADERPVAVGIDLGTTNSVVAASRDGRRRGPARRARLRPGAVGGRLRRRWLGDRRRAGPPAAARPARGGHQLDQAADGPRRRRPEGARRHPAVSSVAAGVRTSLRQDGAGQSSPAAR